MNKTFNTNGGCNIRFNLHVKDMNTFFESSDMNIVFLSVPITILSFANSNCEAVSFSAPSTAALMAAIFTKFARSDQVENEKRKYRNGEVQASRHKL